MTAHERRTRLTVLCVSAASAEACTKSWAAAVDGAWTNAALWSPTGVPTATDDVCVTVDGTYKVTVTGSRTVNTVTIGLPGNTGIQTLAVRSGGTTATILTATSGITNASVLELQTLPGSTREPVSP